MFNDKSAILKLVSNRYITYAKSILDWNNNLPIALLYFRFFFLHNLPVSSNLSFTFVNRNRFLQRESFWYFPVLHPFVIFSLNLLFALHLFFFLPFFSFFGKGSFGFWLKPLAIYPRKTMSAPNTTKNLTQKNILASSFSNKLGFDYLIIGFSAKNTFSTF